jgi:hypothetical protein
VFRACVQDSRYDRKLGDFDRQEIWCNEEELRELALAVKDADEGESE